jgi:beta-lactamase regulating signal transducer with metallopeptidase domain
MDKGSFFILNIFLNSLLAFFTVVFLIEGIIFLFRIQRGRVAATLRMIPIFKLLLDPFLYDFARWSYAQGINPLDCGEGTRVLSVTFGWMNYLAHWSLFPVYSCIELTVPGDRTFTPADIVGYTMNPIVLKFFVMLFVSFSVGFVIRRLRLYYRSLIALDSLLKSSRPLHRKFCNPILSSSIKRYGVQILTSPILRGSPFVAGLISSVVYIPAYLLKNLSRNEYEAVLAHEIEHVRYKDSLVRLILDFIGSIFWWVPTKWLCRRIEEDQELGCDLNCKKYGIDLINLASAICKSAKYSINTSNPLFVQNLTKYTVLKRVSLLLQPTSIRFKKIRFVFGFLAIVIAFKVVFFGRFWTF